MSKALHCNLYFSGGQKRRVSLGVALIHSPDFLILDEPTVGVDPLLREKIWKYLTNLSKNENKTVLVTTHFIEEARQADTIGFMRSGRLLAEGKPVELMEIHGAISLEDVFINLCNQGFFCHVILLQLESQSLSRWCNLRSYFQFSPILKQMYTVISLDWRKKSFNV